MWLWIEKESLKNEIRLFLLNTFLGTLRNTEQIVRTCTKWGLFRIFGQWTYTIFFYYICSSLRGAPWTSSPPPSPYPSCFVLAGGFSRLWWSLGKPWWPRLNLRWWISINKWWFVGVTFGWVVLAQKTLCNGAIKIVPKVSPNFVCPFLRNNTVFLGGRHGSRLKR